MRLGLLIECTQFQIFQHGHLGKELTAFRHLHDAAVQNNAGAFAGEVLPVELHLAGAGLDHTCDGAHHGGLTGTVGAKDGNDLAILHLKADVPQDVHRAVTGVQTFNFKHLRPPFWCPDTPP